MSLSDHERFKLTYSDTGACAWVQAIDIETKTNGMIHQEDFSSEPITLPLCLFVWFAKYGGPYTMRKEHYLTCMEHCPDVFDQEKLPMLVFDVHNIGTQQTIREFCRRAPRNLTLYLSDYTARNLTQSNMLSQLLDHCSCVLVAKNWFVPNQPLQLQRLQTCLEPIQHSFEIVACGEFPYFFKKPEVYYTAPYVWSAKFCAQRLPVYKLLRTLGLPSDMARKVMLHWVEAEQRDKVIRDQDYGAALADPAPDPRARTALTLVSALLLAALLRALAAAP